MWLQQLRNQHTSTKVLSLCVLCFVLLNLYILYAYMTHSMLKRNFPCEEQHATLEYYEGKEFLVVMAYDVKAASYGYLSKNINQRYCQEHGYGLIIYHINIIQYHHATIDKIHYVRKSLKYFPYFE